MHSSRMRTILYGSHLLGGVVSGRGGGCLVGDGGVWSGGCLPRRGCLPRGGVCPGGGCLPGGESGQGVSAGGIHPRGQNS